MKKFLVFVLGLSLIFCSTLDSAAGPRSYSSGSSSSGRSYSSGSSSSGRSYSSGSSSKPSYSSGSSSKPSYSSGSSSTPSKSYSSGSSSKPSTPSTSPKPVSVPRPAPSSSVPSGGSGKSYSSGGGKSYSSGVPPPAPSVAPKPSPGTAPGKAYSSGNATYTPAPSAAPSKGGVSYDGNAAAAQKRAESKANYVKGSEPKKTYTTPTGQTAPVNANSAAYRHTHNITHENYVTRDVRIHNFYSTGYVGVPYYSRPIVVYNDPYNSLFWYWMLDRSLEQRAMWAYCHRADMDAARYQALLAHDANLAARVKALEAQKVAVDPNYVPPGLTSPDLMYTDNYVDSVYNPHVVQHHPASASAVGRVLFWIFMTFLVIIILIVLYGLVFVKKW